MHLALLLVGKRQGQVLMATSTPGLPPSRLFFVADRCSGLRFLVDTGAEVSVLPVSRLSRPPPPTGHSLQAVNNSSIATFGAESHTLNLQQLINNMWCPLAYFSRKLTPAQQKYSTFDRELLAMYLAVKHFHYFVEGRDFYIVTDHKPLTYALHSRSTNHSPRQARQLDFISQFTSDIRHLPGRANAAADTLSSIEVAAVAGSPGITPQNLAIAQQEEDVVDVTGDTSLDLRRVSIPATDVTLLCEATTGTLRPYVPQKLRRLIFDHLHGLSHPGIRATQRLIASKYVWPNMNKDVRLVGTV